MTRGRVHSDLVTLNNGAWCKDWQHPPGLELSEWTVHVLYILSTVQFCRVCGQSHSFLVGSVTFVTGLLLSARATLNWIVITFPLTVYSEIHFSKKFEKIIYCWCIIEM